MIAGIGNDIIEISRIKSAIERHGEKFLDRLFTEKEKNYCLKFKDSEKHFAGRFAAKEAISKALGTGFCDSLGWLDIEIINNEKGAPIVTLSKQAQKRFNFSNLLLSISHSENYATAFAISTVV